MSYMINVEAAAGHMLVCTAELTDCFECQAYLVAEPEAVANTVLIAARRIYEHAITIVEAALPVS